MAGALLFIRRAFRPEAAEGEGEGGRTYFAGELSKLGRMSVPERWGLALFALTAGAPPLFALTGAAAITLLFVFISIPLIEKRMRVRRTGWLEHAKSVPILLPWRVGPFRSRR